MSPLRASRGAYAVDHSADAGAAVAGQQCQCGDDGIGTPVPDSARAKNTATVFKFGGAESRRRSRGAAVVAQQVKHRGEIGASEQHRSRRPPSRGAGARGSRRTTASVLPFTLPIRSRKLNDGSAKGLRFQNDMRRRLR